MNETAQPLKEGRFDPGMIQLPGISAMMNPPTSQ